MKGKLPAAAVTLSIVIITRDTKELLRKLLRSIGQDGSLNAFLRETIIIDNASADGTGDMTGSEFPWTVYIRNDRNMGFAASANQGIGRSTGKYALLLNSDTILIEGEIAKMLAFMEDNVDVGICGPQLVYPDMRLQRSSASIPSLTTELFPFLSPRPTPSALSPQPSAISRQPSADNRSLGSHCEPEGRGNLIPLSGIDVPSLIGAAMMIRRSLFQELSGFDEQFFFFLEETDLCLRAQQPSAVRNEERGSRIEDRATTGRHPASSIEYPVSGIRHPASSIQHRASSIEHPASSIDETGSSPSGSPPRTSHLAPRSSRVVLLPDVRAIHLQGKTVGKNWIKGRIEYNISLYKFIKKHHGPLYYRTFQAVRLSKSIFVIIVLSLLPFLLIGKGTRRRYAYYWKILLWHLASCPPTAGLKDLAPS